MECKKMHAMNNIKFTCSCC